MTYLRRCNMWISKRTFPTNNNLKPGGCNLSKLCLTTQWRKTSRSRGCKEPSQVLENNKITRRQKKGPGKTAGWGLIWKPWKRSLLQELMPSLWTSDLFKPNKIHRNFKWMLDSPMLSTEELMFRTTRLLHPKRHKTQVFHSQISLLLQKSIM